MSRQTAAQVDVDRVGFEQAYAQAVAGAKEGGIPIGSALVWHADEGGDGGKLLMLGVGRNKRVQDGSPVLHAEMAALEAAGRLKAGVYRKSTIYTTLSPCSMCSGAILLYGIPRVVVGENENFRGEEDLLRSRGVEVVVLNDQKCVDMMRRFIEEKPEEWYEDIGEETDDSVREKA